MISYVSTLGYKGILYGQSSLKIIDPNGVDVVFHTSARNINTIGELKELIDGFPEQSKHMLELYERLSK